MPGIPPYGNAESSAFFFVPRGFEPGFPRKAASETYLVQMFRYPVLLYKYPEREVVRKYNEYKI
jgi:hypothetical protein|nr:MAG TPA: hypothetical protein [Caudoviricetes sp.]